MYGKLEKDMLGNILCDCCGKEKKYYTFKTSRMVREFISCPNCDRKLVHLCLKCTKVFITVTGGIAPK
jgi:hypothetical protein